MKTPDLQLPNYTYRAEVVKVVDGDTIDVTIDLGFRIGAVQRLRLMDVNAWETRGFERPAGLAAKQYVEARLNLSDKIYVQTIKDTKGKYGRLLAWVWTEIAGEVSCLNDDLVMMGHAENVKY